MQLDEEKSKSNGLASALGKAKEDLLQEREAVKGYETRLSAATAKVWSTYERSVDGLLSNAHM